ncbi:hypothetical protein, variant 5 [Phialophora macrospora]|uniref:Acyltransferase 3 domain-containing protein n=1 Tax=Phialophora macrospora TaxID=1851006 RepID=A0A0D2FL39_9EURO|nr:hypothetical protein PV04_06693 [Phialophora macrospora]KIW67439.1 hypothetical protein, variant 1 [Phialophora macrospora]KIW67440.1 hypothetical protein, variant 2 [Phialophora macrospora]KIW67441.1 hypothetical protein, variant 3 [Phialophora macrospora]KIW67442.1 hypothetical protein, variant 4 [Phialophora macrospora]
MAQYIPLLNENPASDDYTDHLELSDVDIEKIPEPSVVPKWYHLPGWRASSSRWQPIMKWNGWSKEDIPDAKTAALLVLSYFVAALPRFLQPGGLKITRKLHATSYLDALRGWAALFVFRFHMFYNKTWLFNQFVFSGFLNGRAMVEVFFVISGYVLSYRLLTMIRNQQPGLLRALASSTFRRWFRLFIPTGFGSLIVAILSYLGWCRWDLTLDSFPAQMWDWFRDFLWASNPFAEVQGWWFGGVFCTKYLGPMWTIPVEFRGSIVLFSFCAVAAYLSTKGRRICCATFILLCYYWGAIYAALFLMGMFIADLQFDRHPDRLQSKKQLPQQEQQQQQHQHQQQQETTDEASQSVPSSSPDQMSSSGKKKDSILRKVSCTLLVIVALFLFGQPKDGWSYKGPFPYDYLSLVIPPWYSVGLGEYFWLSIGAILLVFGLDNCRMLQIPFEWSFSQYLGDISFGIYVMHDIVNWTLYEQVVEPFRAAHFGDGYWSGLPGMLVTTVVVLWCADWFSRIDDRVVWLGKWLENKAFIKWDEVS